MIDVDLAREMIYLKAKDLGLDDEKLESLDILVCSQLKIKDPDPFIYPT
jgi:hypothetical protein